MLHSLEVEASGLRTADEDNGLGLKLPIVETLLELGFGEAFGHLLVKGIQVTLHDRLDVDETGSGRPLQAEELVPGYGYDVGRDLTHGSNTTVVEVETETVHEVPFA